MSSLTNIISEEGLKPTGVHISHPPVSKNMEIFVKEITNTGAVLFDTAKILDRIYIAGKFLANKKIAAYSSQNHMEKGIKLFSELTKSIPLFHDSPPGIFSNTILPSYVDVDVVIVGNPNIGRITSKNREYLKIKQIPHYEARVIEEANKVGIPIIAFCSADAITENIDLIIPGNNIGYHSSATLWYLLTRSVLIMRKELSPKEEMKYNISMFEGSE